MSNITPIEKTKDVTIEEVDGTSRAFQIGRITADQGNWIVTQVLGGRSREDGTFQRIEAALLNVCFMYTGKEGTAGEKIKTPVAKDGRILIPDLQFAIWTRNQLCEAVMDFNFSPFFEKLRAKQQAKEELELASAT